jgi:oligopeptide/dipeptide ABC transporter ATP-binding protein
MSNKDKNSAALLDIEDLNVGFTTRGGVVSAVRDVSFKLYPGETLGIVGESGCGKSVTALSILRLIQVPPGRIEARRMNFMGADLTNVPEKQMRGIRGYKISMIFQDPMTSLNPVLTVGLQMRESMKLHLGLEKKALDRRCVELLDMVGISAPEMRIKAYPHQLSGGMRQRVMIAIGISCNPSILLADEPTTGLDVSIQDQILRLMKSLAEKLNMTLVLITHNFGAVAGTTKRIIVMYAGQIVETASTESIFYSPLHPYTKGLLASIPQLHGTEKQRLFSIKGILPNPLNIPVGCGFASRCEYADDTCIHTMPELTEHRPNHYAACWKVK